METSALFEGIENPRLMFGFDSDPGVGDLKDKPPFLVRGPNRDSPSVRSKLHRVVQQIPKDLLDPDRISRDVMLLGAKVRRHLPAPSARYPRARS